MATSCNLLSLVLVPPIFRFLITNGHLQQTLSYLLVELGLRHDSPAERLELRQAGVVGRLLEVLGVLVEPHVDGLAQRPQVLLPHRLTHRRLRVAQEIVPERLRGRNNINRDSSLFNES